MNRVCWYLLVGLAFSVTLKLISTKPDGGMGNIIVLLQTSSKSACGKERETRICLLGTQFSDGCGSAG